MKAHSRLASRILKNGLHLAAATSAIAVLGAVSGCLSRPIAITEPLTTSTVVDKLQQSGVNKIDLVLVVDNSSSMGDKQALLSLAVPDLVNGLVNPACLDNTTNQPITTGQPTSPLASCPSGSTRDFPPVLDIHIGLLSSSLGDFGAPGACPNTPPASCSGSSAPIDFNDQGHLVTRTSGCNAAAVPTYQNYGFLAWDPAGTDTPPGETDLATLQAHLTSLVTGDDQLGCGFESQNESWYRFLVDPSPYASITFNSSNQAVSSVSCTGATCTGIDTALIQQRAEFLRPDSLLAIIEVTDETDVSVKQFSGYPIFTDTSVHLPMARSECSDPTKGPTDPCCFSCSQAVPATCPVEANCTPSTYYSDTTENPNLRAFGLSSGLQSHKARYGIEFMYPVSRYVNALTSLTVANAGNTQVPNPIYSILNSTTDVANVRSTGLVFYAAIVGVPWQLIARQTSAGVPDLVNGVDSLDSTQVGGFKTAAELDLTDSAGHTFWDDIAGDPDNYVPPLSPFMVESTTPRSGKDPITGVTIAPPTTANGAGPQVGGTVLNDHEWIPSTPAGDIEYACIFPLAQNDYRDCSTVTGSCNCNGNTAANDNPLCSSNPNDSGHPTLQTSAKAYPGTKHLAIARGMGSQGIAASICPVQTTDNTKTDYGYRPAVQAIINRLKLALHNQCLPRTLSPDPTTGYEQGCVILEAQHVPDAQVASCNACPATVNGAPTARQPVPTGQEAVISAAKSDPAYTAAQWNCFCEITEPDPSTTAGAAALQDCLTSSTPASTTNGWCYVSPATANAANESGEAALVSKCPATEQQEIRFVGAGKQINGSTLFITCTGS